MKKPQMIAVFALLYLVSQAFLLWGFGYETGVRNFTAALKIFSLSALVLVALAFIPVIGQFALSDNLEQFYMLDDSPIKNGTLWVLILFFVYAVPVNWLLLMTFKKWSFIGPGLLVSLILNATFLFIMYSYYKR